MAAVGKELASPAAGTLCEQVARQMNAFLDAFKER